MEKLLTISIAAYNVQNFIEKTLKSLLIENINDLEILVEDDGGTDNTADIVKQYEEKYPGIVKLIHKENGGYGSTINKSIEIANGKYFKQLDGDDWYDTDNFRKLLDVLRNVEADVVYTPYIEYREVLEQKDIKDYFNENISGLYEIDKIIGLCTHYLSMYTVLFRTQILKRNGISLQEKCLYTDKEYAMYPMLFAKNIYITHLPIYVYRIGRNEQSVSIESKRKHYEEQIRVVKKCIDFVLTNIKQVDDSIKEYMYKYLGSEAATTINSFLILLPIEKNTLELIKEFIKYISDVDRNIFREMYKKSKLVKVLINTRCNSVIYRVIAFLKINKIEKENRRSFR